MGLDELKQRERIRSRFFYFCYINCMEEFLLISRMSEMVSEKKSVRLPH